jgi:hypothetical protein
MNGCPYCKSENITYTDEAWESSLPEVFVDAFAIRLERACLDCGRMWYEEFVLRRLILDEGIVPVVVTEAIAAGQLKLEVEDDERAQSLELQAKSGGLDDLSIFVARVRS